MAEFKILSIDGGGIRGVFPAAYLEYIEKHLDSSIYNYFDMIVGTSTGSIIALALAMDIKASDILNVYKEKGKKIFSKQLRSLTKGIIFPKYSDRYLINELKDLFGESLLKESKTRVCVPTIDIVNGKTIVRKTRHHKEFFEDIKIPIWKIAAQSCAAPGYFPAFEGQYIDGGLWANNPSLVAITEALMLGNRLDDIKLLSIGTGNTIFHKEGWQVRSLGLLGYRTSIIDITFQAQSQGVCNTANYLLRDNYKRIDTDLPNGNKFKLDNINSIASLIKKAEYKAKDTLSTIKPIFFNNMVLPFKAVP